MEIIIHPYLGIEIKEKMLKFGYSRSEIWKLIGQPQRQFEKTEMSESLDIYSFMHIEYDSNDLCSAFEIFDPAIPQFNGFNFLQKPFSECLSFLKLINDPSISCDDLGLNSDKYGIGLYCPHVEDNGRIEAVLVYKKNYYDILQV